MFARGPVLQKGGKVEGAAAFHMVTQTRRVRSPLGAVTMVPPGGWSLVDNKRNTHTHTWKIHVFQNKALFWYTWIFYV
jgi:hypothetical protein